MMNTHESKPTPKNNISSQPWNDSDLVLAVGDKEYHVHRYILSFQSPVFKAMFNANGHFNTIQRYRIELTHESYEAMLHFLKLLYPPSTLNGAVEVNINDENILQIIEVADKYGAINIIRQCMKETGRLKPENAMRLLPYALRHKLPREEIAEVIKRHVSTEKLKELEPKLQNDPRVYAETLVEKCHFLEDYATRANSMMNSLLQIAVSARRVACSQTTLSGFGTSTMVAASNSHIHDACRQNPIAMPSGNVRSIRECENCFRASIEKYVFPDDRMSPFSPCALPLPLLSSFPLQFAPPSPHAKTEDLIDLFKLSDDIATSLQR